jgi:predicted ABC-type ATPase
MIHVIAGVNGAGKSSIAGAALRARGLGYVNANEEAAALAVRFPDRSPEDLASVAWQEGVRRLQRAIATDRDHAFETTLGGRTITDLLLDACVQGVDVAIWHCGLRSVDLHLQRVAQRVARGGHDIDEARIRARWTSSMSNLCRLTAVCSELVVYDNSLPLDADGRPQLQRLLHMKKGALLFGPPPDLPAWARPVAAAALVRARR